MVRNAGCLNFLSQSVLVRGHGMHLAFANHSAPPPYILSDRHQEGNANETHSVVKKLDLVTSA